MDAFYVFQAQTRYIFLVSHRRWEGKLTLFSIVITFTSGVGVTFALCQPTPIRPGMGGGELTRDTARRAALAVFSRKRVPYPNIIH